MPLQLSHVPHLLDPISTSITKSQSAIRSVAHTNTTARMGVSNYGLWKGTPASWNGTGMYSNLDLEGQETRQFTGVGTEVVHPFPNIDPG